MGLDDWISLVNKFNDDFLLTRLNKYFLYSVHRDSPHILKMSILNSNNSFDRYGDDLTGLLLSYLPAKEKFRYECISRQWKRLIFNNIYGIQIGKLENEVDRGSHILIRLSKNSVDLSMLEKILDKCLNIKSVLVSEFITGHEFSNRELVFKLLIKKCNNLNRFPKNFHVNDESLMMDFLEKFGKKINVVSCTSDIQEEGNMMDLYKRKLTNLKKIYLAYNNGTSGGFLKLININPDKLEAVEIRIRITSDVTIKRLEDLIESVVSLKNIKSFVFGAIITNDEIVDFLMSKLISLKKLNRLSLVMIGISPETNLRMYRSLDKLKGLEFIDVSVSTRETKEANESLKLISADLKGLKNLRALCLNSTMNLINDDFFEGINVNLPNLQVLKLSPTSTKDLSLVILSKLPNIRKVNISSDADEKLLTDTNFLTKLNNFRKIENIHFRAESYDIHLSERDILIWKGIFQRTIDSIYQNK